MTVIPARPPAGTVTVAPSGRRTASAGAGRPVASRSSAARFRVSGVEPVLV
ncbi:hypothetical protein ACFRMO_11160 [Streptomyces anulatus]|uniref:hypothetical protein n=1 Tax=Streptomyces TaxID=1883 RepID=UPI0035A17545